MEEDQRRLTKSRRGSQGRLKLQLPLHQTLILNEENGSNQRKLAALDQNW